ncbi:MAG: tetratricopeptide repeat protein [Acidobacteriota bacterium]
MSINKSKVLRTAEKYALQGKIPAAIDEYKKVVTADPTDLTTINTLGDLYVRAGRIQEAISNFSRIAESYRESGFILKAIAMLKKISKLDPTNIETAMKLANLYSQQGLLVEARQQYLQVADAYARAGQTRKALEAYQKIADLDPSNTSVRMKLGEIYAREKLFDHAHDSFIMAGAEFLRKGDNEQALNANLKAISINPESRQGLTAIANIYTQMGQPDKAINILCDAFEKNPGDVELLTILGRTYLSAGFMDDAERTFLSLVQLDRNRYNYLLEVGRIFLQRGELDRAAEQIDGCLDVLISKREEDKAIDFLRRVLDRDMNHTGSLRRLAQIFQRIREDHNLIATLNSLVEAALSKGEEAVAIGALKELATLEPDEPMHLQRLYNLGVQGIVEPGSPDVVRATGPFDYQAAAFDDTFVIRQISEAEMLAGRGQVEHAVMILQGILAHVPENVQVHLKLKDIYLRAGMLDKAAQECFELARIHEIRGESARASDYVAEAHQLNPLLGPAPQPQVGASDAGWAANSAWGYETGFGSSIVDEPLPADSGFEMSDSSEGFDLSKYVTGELPPEDDILAPAQQAEEDYFAAPAQETIGADYFSAQQEWTPPDEPQAFRFSDSLVDNSYNAQSAAGDFLFSQSSDADSDLIPERLRDELDGVDFYLAQGYTDIARDTLERLQMEFGNHPQLVARFRELGVNIAPDSAPAAPQEEMSFADSYDFQSQVEVPAQDESQQEYVEDKDFGFSFEDLNVSVNTGPLSEAPAPRSELMVDVSRGTKEGENKNIMPIIIKKESGPLYPDLIVQMNTSELLSNSAFDLAQSPSGSIQIPEEVSIGTSELIDSIVSDIDSSLSGFQQRANTPGIESIPQSAAEPPRKEPPVVEPDFGFSISGEPEREESAEMITPAADLQDFFEEIKEDTGNLSQPLDYETHYSLGLAYKDMDLMDEAIEQFQMAAKQGDAATQAIQCCNMLGVCFRMKRMHKVAVMWFERGLKTPLGSEDEYQALRYEIGLCHEEAGDMDRALDAFMEVYAIDVNYRQVSEKIKQLQSLRTA